MTTPLLERWVADHLASRVWARDLSVFVPSGAPARRADVVRQRLGWLNLPVSLAPRVAELVNVAHDYRDEQARHVYLLGMGGSSLCAEVLRDVLPHELHAPHLVVLDTTDERTIREATETLAATHTVFVVASKSGGTIEVASLERHFWDVMEGALGDRAGRQFVAITDPGTALVALANERGYRETFLNPPDVGGRYSALSLFGLVPAALLRQPVEQLLESGRTMATHCQVDAADNPGLALGAFIAQAAEGGRDKLTLLLPPELASFGAWIEQLIAESTGKDGRGVLPIVGEPIGKPSEYGPDRAFVSIALAGQTDLPPIARLAAAAYPTFEIEMNADDLGGELFRWEFATAVAGAALGINPFDEPNVADAKSRTQAQLDARHTQGMFRIDPPFVRGRGYSRREHGRDRDHPPAGRYVAILDYLPREPHRVEVIARLRGALRRHTGWATTHGIGPRYLHSTGQYHKGGPNTGLFLMFTAVDESVSAVPGTDYTFSALKFAQALGDFDALAAAGRHVVHYHIEDPAADYSAALESVLRDYR